MVSSASPPTGTIYQILYDKLEEGIRDVFCLPIIVEGMVSPLNLAVAATWPAQPQNARE